jgi:hypothetical protein
MLVQAVAEEAVVQVLGKHVEPAPEARRGRRRIVVKRWILKDF